jgi:hydrogenase nickel incorporation protein HypA/HybF
MHELSLAEAIVGIATNHAGDRRVTRVELRVGHLRQVVPSALEFAFELVAKDTVAEGATLAMEEVPAAGACRGCGSESKLADFPLRCGRCGSFDVEVIAGEELTVDSLELDEPLAMSAGTSTSGGTTYER